MDADAECWAESCKTWGGEGFSALASTIIIDLREGWKALATARCWRCAAQSLLACSSIFDGRVHSCANLTCYQTHRFYVAFLMIRAGFANCPAGHAWVQLVAAGRADEGRRVDSGRHRHFQLGQTGKHPGGHHARSPLSVGRCSSGERADPGLHSASPALPLPFLVTTCRARLNGR